MSKRAVAAVADMRSEFDWLSERPGTDIVQDPDGTTWWWTFAGTAANAELAAGLGGLASTASTSGLAIRLTDGTTREELGAQLGRGLGQTEVELPEDMADAHKFADVLPRDAAIAMLSARERDPQTVADVAGLSVNSHRLNERALRP